MSRKHKLPFKHIVLEDTKEVLIVIRSAIPTMGVTLMVNKYYPGYTAKIISEIYYQEQTIE